MTGFGIFQLHESHVGKFVGQRVVEHDGNYVVFSRSNEQRLGLVIKRNEVAEDAYDGTFRHDFRDKLQRRCEFGALFLGLESEEFSNDEQNVFSALLGGNELFDFVREKDNAHFVIVLNGGESESARNFCTEFLRGACSRPKLQTGGNVNE